MFQINQGSTQHTSPFLQSGCGSFIRGGKQAPGGTQNPVPIPSGWQNFPSTSFGMPEKIKSNKFNSKLDEICTLSKESNN